MSICCYVSEIDQNDKMKFALVNGDRVEATKGAKGLCPSCGSELIAKCGEIKVNHWAHKGNRNCDPWWENETEWHRSWKDEFPIDWQEVVHFSESGEKHIADVKTESGCVLEFQHSYLKPEERRSRNAFYRQLVWVVDGTRRKRDKPQFQKIYEEGATILEDFLFKVVYPDECRLLEEWIDSNALVFFDFQEDILDAEQSDFWFLFPKTSTRATYISPFSRDKFIELHNDNKFYEQINDLFSYINKELDRKHLIEQINISRSRQNRLQGLANKRRRRRRF